MTHVFLDSSVLISFCASQTGASALVLHYCRERKIRGYISKKVIAETRKNTRNKVGEVAFERFQYTLNQQFLAIEPTPSSEKIKQSNTVINSKDAPILATALANAEIQYLLTLDKKDFLTPQVRQFAKPLQILTPGMFIEMKRLLK